MVGVCKVDKKHEIFDFETIVHQLFITRLDSRAGKLLYSRVLQENSKKSGNKYFFVEITSKIQNSQMTLKSPLSQHVNETPVRSAHFSDE